MTAWFNYFICPISTLTGSIDMLKSISMFILIMILHIHILNYYLKLNKMNHLLDGILSLALNLVE